GAIVANAASQGLGMEVVGYDPFISVESAWSLSRSVKRSNNMEDVFSQADYITLHVPLTDGTKNLVNAEAIAKMKDGVHILNFSRAALVDSGAMIAALASGKVAGYVTDFPTAEFIGVKNAVMIPHLGASTPESEENCAKMAAMELKNYLENGQIQNSVNLPDMMLGYSEGSRVQIIHDNVPNMVSSISAAISAKQININNMLNKSRKEVAVTVMELDTHPDDAVIREIEAIDGVVRVRVFQ
ncbi:MAG: 3-phosphoglycerate dehydrogenase, partial [Clostridiales bacterium]|nr:3-phosphoglycerate dehydrogenase [Clostridiales bacterium]